MNNTTRNPYVGPRTFQKEDGAFFFGREREARDLLALIASERLILFYAQSGAGKSSLLNTSVIPELENGEFEVLPLGRVQGDLPAEIEVENVYTYNLMSSMLTQKIDPAKLANLSFAEFLRRLDFNDNGYFFDADQDTAINAELGWRRVLIVDQFEEIFTAHLDAWVHRDGFFRELAQAMSEDRYLTVILVMRDDYIASLDLYAHLLLGGMRTRYYMQRLTKEAALKAVKNPVENIRPFAAGVAAKLVEDLSEIVVHRAGGGQEKQSGQYVEPVQLQVVCYSLWENLPPEGTEISESDLMEVGDVDESLENFYDHRVASIAKEKDISERALREWFEQELITSSKTRNMVLHEAQSSAGLRNDIVRALQGDLVRAELSAGQVWYELSHDRLIEPILKSNAAWFAANLNVFQQQAELWNRQGRSDGLLLRRQELREAEAWAEANAQHLTGSEIAFLEACRKARNIAQAQALANRRLRKLLRTSTIVAGVAIFLLGVSILLGIQSYQNQRSTSMQVLVNASTIELNKGNKELATRLAYQALDRYGDYGETEQALANIAHPMVPRSSSQIPFIIRNPLWEINSIAFNPGDGGRTLAAGCSDGTILIVDTDSHLLIGQPLTGHTESVTSIAFSPDGKLLASASEDHIIILWDVASQKPIGQPLTESADKFTNVVFSPDGKLLASSSSDHSIILWDVASRKPIGQPLTGHRYSVSNMIFSPDGKLLVSHNTNEIILWNVASQKQIGQPLTKYPYIINLVFSPDGRLLAFNSSGDMILWDVISQKQIGQPLTGHAINGSDIDFSPDSKLLAFNDSGDIILWDIESRKLMGQPLTGHSADVLTFSPDGKLLASTDSSTTEITLWDVASQKPIGQPLIGHRYPMHNIVFSPDGRLLASNDVDMSEIILWDVATHQPIGDPFIGLARDDITMVDTLSFTTDGRITARIDPRASDQPDQRILWNPKTGQQTMEEWDKNQNDPVFHLESIGPYLDGSLYAISPDGKYQANVEFEYIRIVEIATNKEIVRKRKGFLNKPVTAVAFSHDGRYVASGSRSFTIIWKADTGKQIGKIENEKGIEVSSLAFSPDGDRLVIAYNDGKNTVEVWDIASGRKIFIVANRQVQGLGYAVVNSANLFDGEEAPQKDPAEDQDGQIENLIADIVYSQDGLFILYHNGVIDHWDLWPSRAELRKFAESTCGTCELDYARRLDYKLYTLPMQFTNYAGYLIAIIHLVCYGFCIRTVYRAVFARSLPPEHVAGFSWKKFLAASVQGGLLVSLSLAGILTILLLEFLYYGKDSSLRWSDFDLISTFMIFPLGLWAGGAYAHFTRSQAGKLSRTRRVILGSLTGICSGVLPIITLIISLLITAINNRGLQSGMQFFKEESGLIVSTIEEISPFTFISAGVASLLGALLYIFWLGPWSARWREHQQQVQEETDF